jgi:hypothetical protein
MAKSGFPIPDGVTEVEDEYQLELVHFELKNLKPKGTILFSGESKEIGFQFFAGEHKSDGIIARLSNAQSLQARRIFDYLEKYTKIDALITVTLLQFKLMFLAARISVVYQNGQRHLKILFPTKILKTHRRKFIRIPFNDKFPAELKFQTEKGIWVRKLKDLSREGMRIQLEPGDVSLIAPGFKMKQAVLKVLNREMPVGLNVMAVHDAESAGIKIVAISEEDKLWIRDCIRILMGQILGLDPKRFDDRIEKDDSGQGS